MCSWGCFWRWAACSTPWATWRPKTYAGERKSRTDQLLFTSPVSLTGIVAGKFLAGVTVLLGAVALSGIYVLVTALYGRVYPGEVLCGYLGFLLQGCAFLAIDQLISARCRAPVTAAVWSLGVNLALWLLDVLNSAVSLTLVNRILSALSLYMRAAPFQEGQLSLANILYFVAVIVLMQFFTVRTLDARRWSA